MIALYYFYPKNPQNHFFTVLGTFLLIISLNACVDYRRKIKINSTEYSWDAQIRSDFSLVNRRFIDWPTNNLFQGIPASEVAASKSIKSSQHRYRCIIKPLSWDVSKQTSCTDWQIRRSRNVAGLILLLPPWSRFIFHPMRRLCYDKWLLIIIKSTLSDPETWTWRKDQNINCCCTVEVSIE